MARNGSDNVWTGDKSHGNFYCHHCGDQVPIGFQHYHASDVPHLEQKQSTINEQLDILQKIAERGFNQAQSDRISKHIDLWQNVLNEIQRTKKLLQE